MLKDTLLKLLTIPGLSGYDGLTFDFRVYYDKIDSLGIYLGDVNLFQRVPKNMTCTMTDTYSDHMSTFNLGVHCLACYDGSCGYPDSFTLSSSNNYGQTLSTSFNSDGVHTAPDSTYSGWKINYLDSYGWFEDIWSISVVSQSDTVLWDSLVSVFSTSRVINVEMEEAQKEFSKLFQSNDYQK